MTLTKEILTFYNIRIARGWDEPHLLNGFLGDIAVGSPYMQFTDREPPRTGGGRIGELRRMARLHSVDDIHVT